MPSDCTLVAPEKEGVHYACGWGFGRDLCSSWLVIYFFPSSKNCFLRIYHMVPWSKSHRLAFTFLRLLIARVSPTSLLCLFTFHITPVWMVILYNLLVSGYLHLDSHISLCSTSGESKLVSEQGRLSHSLFTGAFKTASIFAWHCDIPSKPICLTARGLCCFPLRVMKAYCQ